MTLPKHTVPIVTIVMLLCIALGGFFFALNEAHRTVVLTTDSIMYVDTARHIAAGEGVTTGILELDSTVSPRPQTQWPPFYSMLMAPLIKAGISPTDAGRYVSAGAFAALILLAGLLLMRLHPTAGIAAGAALLVVPGITKISAAVWADSTYAVIILALCWLGDAFIKQPTRLRSFLLGCIVGIGILTKYLGIILIGAVIVIQLIAFLRHRRMVQSLQHLGFTLLGVVLFVAPMLLYNLAASRPISGAVRSLSSQPFTETINDAWMTLRHDLQATWVLRGLMFTAVASLIAIVITKRRKQLAREWFPRLAVPATVAGIYILGLIAARMLIDTDRIYTRFTAPIYPLIVIVFVILINTALKTIKPIVRTVTLSLIAVIAIGWAVKAYDFHIGPYTVSSNVRAEWVQASTTSRDLIIGNQAAEYALRFGYTVVRLGRQPNDPKLTPESPAALIARWGNSFDRFFIAVSPDLDADQYGEFAAAISREQSTEGLVLIDDQSGQIVYQVPRNQL